MQLIDLHLVSWNRPKMTELVVRTIHRNTTPGTFNLHVYDNGSDDETQNMLRRLDEEGLFKTMFLADKNYGLEYARDFMLRTMVKSEYFVCIDNDCLPPTPGMLGGKDWLDSLCNLMDKYEDFAAISMRTQVMIGTGNIFADADEAGDDIVEFPHPGGSFRIMNTGVVKAVNGWDRGAEGRGAEERYICGKLRDAAYRTAFSTNIRCLHLFGLRDTNLTDRWGYDKDLQPADTGHSDISHPALTNGDDIEEVALYAGEELAHGYCSN